MKSIEVKGLTKTFKVKKKGEGLKASIKALFQKNYEEIVAVKDVSFSIEQGELIGFIGLNGAGKTTTLKMLSGILYPTSGEVAVLGFIPSKREEKFLKQISLVMGQKEQLWSDLPPIDTFKLNKEIYDVTAEDYKRVLDDLVEIFDIKDILNQQVRKLSLGQRMKCEIVASLIHTPKVVFLDEPTIGLDIVTQKKLRTFIKEYNKRYNSTIILTSHYMDDIVEICKRVIMIHKGSIIFDGSIGKLIAEYGEYKQLIVHTPIDSRYKYEEGLSKYGKILHREHPKYVLQVERGEAMRIAGRILTDLPVIDVDILEPNIEDIIIEKYGES